MLIHNGAYSDLKILDIVLLSFLCLAGILILVLLKRTKRQIFVSALFLMLFLICEVGMAIPTPKFLAGDGYAITQQISFIIAFYLSPMVAGMLAYHVLKLIITFVKYRREKT